MGRAKSELEKDLPGGNPQPRAGGGDSLSHPRPVIGEVSQQQTGESLFALCFVKVHDVTPRRLSVTQHVPPREWIEVDTEETQISDFTLVYCLINATIN